MTNMIKFNLKYLMRVEELSFNQLAKKLKKSYTTLYYWAKRGSIKPEELELLRKKFGNVDLYIKKPKKKASVK